MSVASNSLFYALTVDDWERITFYTVASNSTFLGPPSGLCTLSLVSRHVHDAISINSNSRLFARIFRFKFDYTAPMRRLSERWLTSRCLASELVKRFTALGRIRQRSSLRHDDLWTCYLMMSENDGKNERQLADWAGLGEYLEATTLARMRSPPMWYTDIISDSLISWLLWMSISRNANSTIQSSFNKLVVQVMHPFIVTGYRFSSTYAPDSYFHLPICGRTTSVAPHCSGPSPPRTEIIHYSHKLVLATPLVTVPATLITAVRTEELQTEETFPDGAFSLPPDRPTAIAMGAVGPTLEDITRFHFQERIRLPRCSPVTIEAEFDDEEIQTMSLGSESYDEDWSRLVACHDPWIGSMPLRGKVFTPGSMTGSWAGRLMIPDVQALTSVILHPRESPFSVPLQHKPLYWKLQEHHCLRPDESLNSGMGDLDDDDFLNAWLPRGILVKYLEDAIEVFDPDTGMNAHYDTFRARGDIKQHSESAYGRIRNVWCSEVPDTTTGGGSNSDSSDGTSWYSGMASIDDDDEYEDVVSHLSSGVCDIIITGETGESQGDAWGHFTVMGRVRYWDGLIVLLQTPRDPNDVHLGQWIFRGYLHDRNFVGRWRETSTPNGAVGFQGSFVVHKAEGQ
ncbi:hypothetical protein L208DRAFT_1425867 [Tricholoma matsutake]|nr:hypothetical protein L208DRAFT_1425867 [Tricholoma matsutake 945]